MIFPAVVPVVLAAASQEGSMFMLAAIPACNFPKSMCTSLIINSIAL